MAVWVCRRSSSLGYTWGQAQKQARAHLPTCDNGHFPGLMENVLFLCALFPCVFLVPSWRLPDRAGQWRRVSGKAFPQGHILKRQATLGSVVSAGSRYTSWGWSRAGVMARWRHSRLMYCTSATSISRVHFREALCAWRTSMQAHLGGRRAWWGRGFCPPEPMTHRNKPF